MKISVILPVRNGAPYLGEAIESVLTQSRPADELIVVDDGSTDKTPEILAHYSAYIRTIRKAPAGQAAATVAGISAAAGNLLAFQDADDIWAPGRLEMQIAALCADPTLDAVAGLSEQFVSPELDADAQRRLAPAHLVLVGESAPCMLLRRVSYERFGGFDVSLSATFFMEWLARAKAGGLRISILDHVVHRRRLHPTNQGRLNSEARDRELLLTLRRHILRGRHTATPVAAQEESE